MNSFVINVNNKYHEQHPFHLVSPSIRPFFVSWGVFCGVLILLSVMHPSPNIVVGSITPHTIYAPIAFLAYHIFGWFADIMSESRTEKAHTQLVQQGMGAGMALFIASEVMFFFAFF
jgi:cytochrome c oxidase subunit 3